MSLIENVVGIRNTFPISNYHHSLLSRGQRVKQKHCATASQGLGGRSPRWDPNEAASSRWHHDLQDLPKTPRRALCRTDPTVNNSAVRPLRLCMRRFSLNIAWPSQLLLHSIQPPYSINRLSNNILIIIIIKTRRDNELRLSSAVQFYRNHLK